jgi:DNA polymerase-3 subunit epsilon
MPSIGWPEWIRPSPAWDEVTYWALDLEMTGLSASRDHIIAVGMVPVRLGTIRYGERFASLVRLPDGEQPSNEGLAAHHLLPGEYARAPAMGELLPQVDARLRQGVLLLHHAPLDLAFLREAYRRCRLPWPRVRVVDTIDLLLKDHRRRHRFSPHPPAAPTSLPDARASLGLPPYAVHDALSDALATAELFLALRSRLGAGTLRQLR